MYQPHALSKVTGPPLHPAILHRAPLLSKLDGALAGQASGTQENRLRCKLLLLSAPAGYGKTTLLADFARHSSIPCCWYFLDHTDADPSIFLDRLLASIRHRFPDFGKNSLFAQGVSSAPGPSDPAHPLEILVDMLTAAIQTEISERFAIFLCDYHVVNHSDALNVLVNRFLQKLPVHCSLVIESRAFPRLDYVPMIAQRQVIGVGSGDLRFTAQEICDLASLQGVAPLSEEEAAQLMTSFDGWIAGILLGTRLGGVQPLDMKPSTSAHWQSTMLQGDRKKLFDYVVSEVFSHAPDLYAFLKEAVVLQEMAPSICNELLAITNAADLLQQMEQQGLFVTHRGEEQHLLYICHPVLRELLYDELRKHSPERFAWLHQQAAVLFYASHNYEQAIYHALQVSMGNVVEQIILETHLRMLTQSRGETLASWIDGLASLTSALHPKLLLIRARLHLNRGEHLYALPLLEGAITAVSLQRPTLQPDDIPLLEADAKILRSRVFFQQGGYIQAQELCLQVLPTLPIDESMLHAEVSLLLGICANLLGNFHAGIPHLQKALQLLGRHTKTRQTAEVHGALASTYHMVGNFALAEHHVSRALDCWEHLQDKPGKIQSLIRMGLLKQHQGDFSEAETRFIQALTMSREAVHFQRGESYALVSLGELYQDQGLYDQSLATCDDGLSLARQMGDRYLTNCALCVLAMAYLLVGDIATAQLLASEITVQTAGGYELVLRELTYGTILLYERSYEEAYSCLRSVESSLHTMGLKRERLQAALRLAACQFAQGKQAELLKQLEQVAVWLRRDDYEQTAVIELHRLPDLEHFIKTHPELERLRALLNLEDEVQQVQDEAQMPSSLSSEDPAPSLTLMSSDLPELSIRALGEPVVLLDGTPITRWRLARSMELCFFLMNDGRPVHKEKIMDALWSEVEDQIDLERTLRTHIYHLRKALGSDCIVFQAGTYTLNLSSLYQVNYDVATFEKLHTRAKQAIEREDSKAAKEELLKMIVLYHGDYVQSFYSNWCIFRRDELRKLYLDARYHLANITMDQSQFDESLAHWQHMLAFDHCLEEAHYGLMRCYLRQGKRGMALRQYQRCIEALREELDVKPGLAIQRLYQHLVAQ